MRVTNIETTRRFLELVNQQRFNLSEVQQQLSTGIKVATPSDDPGRAGTIAQFNSTLERISRHKERMGYATNILSQQENLLAQTNDLLVRARELATQGGNGTMSVEGRQQIADEVWQIRDNLVALANTTVQGRYIFHGARDDTPPFVEAGYANPATGSPSERYIYDITAAGYDQTRSVNITDSLSVRINTPGNQIFSNAIAAVERLGRALDGYDTLPAAPALPDGTGNAFTFPQDYDLQTADILEAMDLIETARSTEVGPERSDIAGRVARIDLASGILDTVKVDTENARAAIRDTDVVEAASLFQNYQTSLEATLASGAQLTRLSLLDFI